MAFNPFLDNIYNEHWTNYQDAYGGMDPNSFHGGGDSSAPWLGAPEQEGDAAVAAYYADGGAAGAQWQSPDTGVVTRNGAAASTAEFIPWAYQTLLENGHTPEAAAAVLGNFDHETAGFTAFRPYDKSENSFGWAHWNGPRLQAFVQFANQQGLDPSSPQANLMYYLKEVQEGQHVPKDFLNRLNSAGDPGAASRLFADEFERPAAGKEGYNSRASRAMGYYNSFQSGGFEGGQKAPRRGDYGDGYPITQDGWNQPFKQGLDGLLEQARREGRNLSVFSGVRTPEHQAQIMSGSLLKRQGPQAQAWWDQQVRQYNGDWAALDRATRPQLQKWGQTQWVALPGSSGHQNRPGKGATAADLRGDLNWASQNAPKYNIGRPLGNEPWHFQYKDPNTGKFVMQQQPQSPLQGAAGLPVDPVQPYLKMIEEGLYS